ncbi:MAG TPA: ribosome-associated translation inhibitor RaiA [Anaerolineae bacterium]|nr:ribosome-associated translation inhibitor RaiA [Anaerolineae bacterium]
MEMLKIYSRNLELTERLRDYVEKKMTKFERYLPNIESMRVDLAESNARDSARRMVAQITIYVPKSILRAEERGSDIFSTVDSVMDKMYRRIERYKGRRQTMRPVPEVEKVAVPVSEEEEPAEEGFIPEIVRVKEFEVSSITPEEAIEQMELLGHRFYIYVDGNDGRLSVIYRREDGNYGVLKPTY